MQYVAKAGGYVYNQWNSLNPSTLSGAIDVIVIEQDDGTLHCSPWHVRFGKFRIFKPSQKKIDLYVNDRKTDLPMKLGEGGEAFFVFETDNGDLLSKSVLTSPVISPETSPSGTPKLTGLDLNKSEPEDLILDDTKHEDEINSETKIESQKSTNDENIAKSESEPSVESDQKDKSDTSEITVPHKVHSSESPTKSDLSLTPLNRNDAFEKARRITEKLNIPSKIDINGDMVLDMDGYKPSSQKNIDNSDGLFQKIFFDEINNMDSTSVDENGVNFWEKIMVKDEDGKIRIINSKLEHGIPLSDDLDDTEGLKLNNGASSDDEIYPESSANESTVVPSESDEKAFFKTLRLTSDQLKQMRLQYGTNELCFKLSEGNAQVVANLYLWKSNIPIVISDIDGTITKSDAMGHLLNLIGRDWTHPGVAKLFQDISSNGYNIIYLTARSVGQSDTTRQYLRSICQDGFNLPPGPVILSPDRTFAALRREIVLKQPEVFKMACLNDIKSLYFNSGFLDSEVEDDRTPFYAGFGNRITDAISYRSVKIPSHRIFTINPDGEVHMELLELTGRRSTYLAIGEIVDLFFPPLPEVSTLTADYNKDQYENYVNTHDLQEPSSPRSPGFMPIAIDEKFTDVNYWRENINYSDLTDLEDEDEAAYPGSPPKSPKPPKSPQVNELETIKSEEGNVKLRDSKTSNAKNEEDSTPSKSRPSSMASFASPLKSFMMFGNRKGDENSEFTIPGSFNQKEIVGPDEDDFTDGDDDIVDDDDDVVDDDDDDDDDDDYEDDYEDVEDDDNDEEEDEDEENEDDFEDDYYDDDAIDEEEDFNESLDKLNSKDPVAKFVKASEFEKLKIDDK